MIQRNKGKNVKKLIKFKKSISKLNHCYNHTWFCESYLDLDLMKGHLFPTCWNGWWYVSSLSPLIGFHDPF